VRLVPDRLPGAPGAMKRAVPLLSRLLLAALLVAALAAPAGAAAGRTKTLSTAWGTMLRELTYGTSVAVAPDGVPWFGVEDSSGPLLVGVEEDKLSLDYLYGEKRERPVSVT